MKKLIYNKFIYNQREIHSKTTNFNTFFKDIDLSSLDNLILKVESELISKNLNVEKNFFINLMLAILDSQYNQNKLEENFVKIQDWAGIYALSKKEFEDKVKLHNKDLVMPKLDEYKEEKSRFLNWIDYNTPSVKNYTVTPLLGTQFYDSDFPLHEQWKFALSYLLWEYDILKKAKIYMDKFDSNLPSEYKEAYTYWVNRQFLIMQPIGLMFREICEDFLYVLLNILLGKSILQDFNLKINLKNDKEFDFNLKSIVSNHYDINQEGYKSLKELRIYKSNHLYSIKQLEKFFNKVK
jgi:hypothetical protein